MADRVLRVLVVGDAEKLERTFAKAQRSTRGFGRDLERGGRGAAVAAIGYSGLGRSVAFASAAFLGGAGLVTVLKSSVSAASNLAEQTSKSDVVFGRSAAGIEAWAKTTVTSMGLAEDQALETASSFGALLRPIGLTGSAAAQQSQRLTKLGADLASFYNTSVQDALDAIRSGLVGEVEPLRRYGVLLSETRVQQEAFAETGKRTAAALTPQEKVMARLALVFKDTAQAQDDFTRTSDGLANQQRILSANVRQLQIALGQAVIPEVVKITRGLNDWLGKTENQERVQRDLHEAVSASVKVIDALAAAVAKVDHGFQAASRSTRGWRDSVKDSNERFEEWVRTGTSEAFSRTVKQITGLSVLQKGPDPGWTAFFDGIVKVAHAGNIAALDQLEALRGQRDLGRRVGGPPAKISGTAFGIGGAPPTAAQQRAIALARTSGTGTAAEVAAINARLAVEDAAIAFAQKRLAAGRGNLRSLADQLANRFANQRGLLDRLAAISQANAARAKAARDKIKQAREAGLQAIQDSISGIALGVEGGPLSLAAINRAVSQNEAHARQRAQFRALGLTATGEALAPTRRALQAGLASIEKSIGGTLLDTDKNRNLIGRIRKVLSGQFGALSRDVRLKIKDLEDALKGDKGDVLDPNAFRKIGGARFREQLGLNLSGLAARRFDAAFATVGAGGAVPARSSAAFSAGRPVVIHLDGREVGRAMIPHLEDAELKRAARRPVVRRGAR